MCFCVYNTKYRNMSAAGSDSDAETVITEGTIERGKGSTEKETVGKVSQLTVMSPGLPASYVSAILESCAVVLISFSIRCP